MNKILTSLFVCASLMLTACSDTLIGQFTVNEDITFSDEKDSTTIPTGTYEAKVKVKKSGDHLTLKAEVKNEELTKKFSFMLPKDAFDENMKNIFIDRKKIKQDFDITGSRTTEHETGRLIRGTEFCEGPQRYVCFWNGHEKICYYERNSGVRDVEYRIIFYTEQTNIDFQKSDSHKLAHFTSARNWQRKVYEFVGYCM